MCNICIDYSGIVLMEVCQKQHKYLLSLDTFKERQICLFKLHKIKERNNAKIECIVAYSIPFFYYKQILLKLC